jgi:geranylgeranyl diphosphate synthase, type III
LPQESITTMAPPHSSEPPPPPPPPPPSQPQQIPLNKPSIEESQLLEPFHYINSVPGKDVRGKLIDCFQSWFHVTDAVVLDQIRTIVGDLHHASLLIDDIEDNSKLRRGIPVAHSIFGVPATINAANYAYFIALQRCQALNSPVALKVFVDEMLNLHRGQGYDIAWRDHVRCPTEDEYLQMVRDKTGGLFRLAVGLLQCFATQHTDTDFTTLVNDLAAYFQIRDDYINLADETYMKSKSFCEDITEGKFSFPMVHAIRMQQQALNNPSTQLLSILKQKTEDNDIKRYAQSLLRQLGSLNYTLQKCAMLKESIERQVEAFGGNPALLQILQLLHVQLGQLDHSSTTNDDHRDGNNSKAKGSNLASPIDEP